MLLNVVACCCPKFETGQTWSYVQTDAATPNNVGSCWRTVLHPFAHGLIATSYLEIVSKLAHLLGPLEQKTNWCRRDHPLSNHGFVNTRSWRHCPNMGSHTQIWSKMQILEGYSEFGSFWYIARDYEFAAEAIWLLSSVASLAINDHHSVQQSYQ